MSKFRSLNQDAFDEALKGFKSEFEGKCAFLERARFYNSTVEIASKAIERKAPKKIFHGNNLFNRRKQRKKACVRCGNVFYDRNKWIPYLGVDELIRIHCSPTCYRKWIVARGLQVQLTDQVGIERELKRVRYALVTESESKGGGNVTKIEIMKKRESNLLAAGTGKLIPMEPPYRLRMRFHSLGQTRPKVFKRVPKNWRPTRS